MVWRCARRKPHLCGAVFGFAAGFTEAMCNIAAPGSASGLAPA